MPSGKQGPATGLALDFVNYVNAQLARRGWTQEKFASLSGLSKNYTAVRLRAEMPFNLKDVQKIAAAFEIDPAEMMLRVENEYLANYEGKLIPTYGVVYSTQLGMEVYRAEDVEVPLESPVRLRVVRPEETHEIQEERYAADTGNERPDEEYRQP